jgi:hypothetical protein
MRRVQGWNRTFSANAILGDTQNGFRKAYPVRRARRPFVEDWDAVVLIQAKDLDKRLGQAGRRGPEPVDDSFLVGVSSNLMQKNRLFFAMDAEDDETFVGRVCVVRGARAQSWH